MEVKVSKWGHSLGVRIPQYVASQLSIKENDLLDCQVKADEMIFLKKKTTKQLFEEFYGKSYEDITQEDIGSEGEIDWGNDVGGENF